MIATVRGLAEQLRELAARIPGFDAAVESVAAEQRKGAPLLAGGLAYRFFFWVVSFGLFAAAILSFWVRSSAEDVSSTAKSFGLAGVATNSAVTAVNDGSKARWYFLVSGIALMVYFGTGAIRALRLSAVLAWGLEPVKLQRPFRASLVFSAVVIAAFCVGLASQWERHHVPGTGLLAICGGGVIYAWGAAIAFQLLPHGRISSWRTLLPGAIEVAVGLTVIQLVVVYYLAAKLERSPNLYGTLGASTVVLLWLFLFARLIISGMFLNATLQQRRERREGSRSGGLPVEQPCGARL